MRGYVTAESDVFRKFLENLKYVLVDAGIDQFEAASVAETVGPVTVVAQFATFMDSRIYHGRNTNLAAALRDAAGSRSGTTLILTDGIMSMSKAAAVTATSAGACAAGSDAGCIASAAANLIANGNAFWIVGMRLPYAGPYYVEEPGPRSRRGLALACNGPHPFYIWIASHDLKQGISIVKGLVKFASAHSVDEISFEVAPGTWQGWDFLQKSSAETLRPSSDPVCRNGDLISNVSGKTLTVQSARKGWFVKNAPVLGFALPVAHSSASNSGALPLINVVQDIVVDDPQVSMKWITVGTTQKFLDICMRYEGDLARSRSGRSVAVNSEWSCQQTKDAPWQEWSTDTDDNCRELDRTVNLDIFLRLLRDQVIGTGSGSCTTTKLLSIRYPK
jgi:hypothetical protein